MGTTQLYKDGDTMAIRTTTEGEDEFLRQISGLFREMIEKNVFEGTWEFQFQKWIPQVVDISCKFRGYKSNVEEKKMLTAGSFSESSDDLVIEHTGRDVSLNGALVEGKKE